MNKTEALEQKIRQLAQERFKVTRRVVDCLEISETRQGCITCSDRALCVRLRGIIL